MIHAIVGTVKIPISNALTAILVHEALDADHHLEHFVAEAGERDRESAQRVLEHIEAGGDDAAEHSLIELLESMEHQHHQHD